MKLIVASYQEMDSIVQTSTQSFFGKRNFKKKKKEAKKELEEATHGQDKNLNNEEAEKRSDVANDSQDEELPNKEAPVERIAEEATDYGQDEKLSSKENDIHVELLTDCQDKRQGKLSDPPTDQSSEKRNLTLKTAEKLIKSNDHHIADWLDIKASNGLVTSMSCKCCEQFKDRIISLRNCLPEWVTGTSNVRLSAAKSHAVSSPHSYAYGLYCKFKEKNPIT